MPCSIVNGGSACACPCSTPTECWHARRACRSRCRCPRPPRPPRTDASPRNAWKSPIALPPPTHATSVGQSAASARTARAPRCNRRHDRIDRERMGLALARANVVRSRTRVTRQRLVGGVAQACAGQLRPRAPRRPAGCARRSARRRASSLPMYTTHSSPARRAAVATPCWPAPVSAITRGFAHALREQALAVVLLILCAPVYSGPRA